MNSKHVQAQTLVACGSHGHMYIKKNQVLTILLSLTKSTVFFECLLQVTLSSSFTLHDIIRFSDNFLLFFHAFKANSILKRLLTTKLYWKIAEVLMRHLIFIHLNNQLRMEPVTQPLPLTDESGLTHISTVRRSHYFSFYIFSEYLHYFNQTFIIIFISFAAQSSIVITMNQGVRGGKVTELKKTVDTAVQSCPTVRHVFVAMRTEKLVPMTDRDVLMDEVRRVSSQDRALVVICRWPL